MKKIAILITALLLVNGVAYSNGGASNPNGNGVDVRLGRVETDLSDLENRVTDLENMEFRDGVDGKDGKDGLNGVDGKDGEKGDKGDQGIQGEKGVADQEVLDNIDKNIESNKEEISRVDRQVARLDNKIDSVQKESRRGIAGVAGMTSVDFKRLEVGEVGIGVGLGAYKGTTSVAVGVGYQVTEDFSVNVKGAHSEGEWVVGAGATWKFKVK